MNRTIIIIVPKFQMLSYHSVPDTEKNTEDTEEFFDQMNYGFFRFENDWTTKDYSGSL